MTSSADPATAPLANKELPGVAGDPHHTAVPVPLQQMPRGKLATTCIARATGHLGQYRLHIFYTEVCTLVKLLLCVHTEGNNPTKIFNPDL